MPVSRRSSSAGFLFRVAVDPLGARDLELVLLQSEGSVLRQYERDFEGYGVDLTVSRDAIAVIAKKAADEKTGARGLVTVLERTFREFKYELPCAGITELHCDAATVENPRATLDRLLEGVDGARDDVRKATRRASGPSFCKALIERHARRLVGGFPHGRGEGAPRAVRARLTRRSSTILDWRRRCTRCRADEIRRGAAVELLLDREAVKRCSTTSLMLKRRTTTRTRTTTKPVASSSDDAATPGAVIWAPW